MSHTPTALLTEERYNELKNEGSPRGYSLLSHVFKLLEQVADANIRSTEATRLYRAFKEAYTWFETKAVIDPAQLDALELSLINEVERQVDAPAPADPAPTSPPAPTPGTPAPADPPTAPAPTARTFEPSDEEPSWLADYDRRAVAPLYERTDELDRRVKALEDAFPRDSAGRFVHFTEWSNHTVNVAGHAVRWTPAVAAFVATLFILLLIKDPTWPATGFMSSLSDWSKMIISGIVSIIAFFLTNRTPSSESAPAA